MDAYNAYYSNGDKKEEIHPPLADQAKSTNIINNIMHINHSGANINITTAPNCQNNFIFNHTAPINLNFYKDSSKPTTSQTGDKLPENLEDGPVGE